MLELTPLEVGILELALDEPLDSGKELLGKPDDGALDDKLGVYGPYGGGLNVGIGDDDGGMLELGALLETMPVEAGVLDGYDVGYGGEDEGKEFETGETAVPLLDGAVDSDTDDDGRPEEGAEDVSMQVVEELVYEMPVPVDAGIGELCEPLRFSFEELWDDDVGIEDEPVPVTGPV